MAQQQQQKPSCRRRYPESDMLASWWPPGPEGAQHPLRANPQPESSRSKSQPAVPAGGRARSFCPPSRGKQSQADLHTLDTVSSNVPLGNAISRRERSAQPPPAFEGAAGKSSQEKKQASVKTGYAWGRPEEAQVEVQRAFKGAAGMPQTRKAQKDTSPNPNIKVKFHHHAASKNFHRGLHSGDVNESGVYDFFPTSQGRIARSVPKRKTVTGALLRGADPTLASTPTDLREIEAIYKGAAGVSSGDWADARYSSTTHWN